MLTVNHMIYNEEFNISIYTKAKKKPKNKMYLVLFVRFLNIFVELFQVTYNGHIIKSGMRPREQEF